MAPYLAWSIQFQFHDKMIELCNQFVYLGLLFNYNGLFTVTQKTLSEQGKNATFSLLSKIHEDFF
jgi:hypothetical protein